MFAVICNEKRPFCESNNQGFASCQAPAARCRAPVASANGGVGGSGGSQSAAPCLQAGCWACPELYGTSSCQILALAWPPPLPPPACPPAPSGNSVLMNASANSFTFRFKWPNYIEHSMISAFRRHFRIRPPRLATCIPCVQAQANRLLAQPAVPMRRAFCIGRAISKSTLAPRAVDGRGVRSNAETCYIT